MEVFEKYCCSCSACVSVCPRNALNIEQDIKGFYKPVVDANKCNNCGLCKNVCPIHSKKWKNQIKPLKAYAATNINENILMSSSSGGVFYELAKKVIEYGGVVYGCAWDAITSASHIAIEDINNINLLMKSKYVQSNVGTIYRSVRQNLLSDRLVLFSGTPCQAAGLKSFLGKDYENLIIVDFICHGVPSPKTYSIFINQLEKEFGKKVSLVNFRTKENGWNTLSIEIKFSDNSKIIEKASENSYYRAFLSNLGLSDSCGKCRYNCLPRTSDITLGDFWGIEKINSDLMNENGVSCIVINSNQGQQWYSEISGAFTQSEISIDAIMKGNPFLNGHCKMHSRSQAFFNRLGKEEFEYLVNRLLTPTKIEVLHEVFSYQLKKIRQKIVNLWIKCRVYFEKKQKAKAIKIRDFTIISNNCWGGMIYSKYGLKYQSPTVGLYILGHDFVKLCSDWKAYFNKELEFISWESSTQYANLKGKDPYPVAKLGDIEIYFMHYHSEEEARQKWERRRKRINPEHMLFKLSQREGCSKEDVKEFMKLPLKHKICFSYDNVPGTVNVPELEGFVGDECSILEEYFDEVKILNEL